MLLKLRSVRMRDYIAGLEDSRGERLQTREFIAGNGVTVGKDSDSVWISGPKRTIVIPWSSVLQCELDTEWWDAGGGDTDAAQVQAYGDRASDVGGGVLPWVPSLRPLTDDERHLTERVKPLFGVTPAAYPPTAVYPNEAEQRTQATAIAEPPSDVEDKRLGSVELPEGADPTTVQIRADMQLSCKRPGARSWGSAEWAATDAFEALSDAIGAPMRMVESVGDSVHTEVDTPSQPVHTEADTAPKPLSRKQRRKRR